MFRNRLTLAFHNSIQQRAGSPARLEFKAAAGGAVEILVYDEIAPWAIRAGDFVRQLSNINATSITVRINSIGGDVFEGLAIYRALRDHPADVATQVDGIAASIASVIMLAGDRRTVRPEAMVMVHKPFAHIGGTDDDMEAARDALRKMGDVIAGVYADRAGGTEAGWLEAMSDETWFNAAEAIETGLATETGEESDAAAAAAAAAFDYSQFRHTPDEWAAAITQLDKPADAGRDTTAQSAIADWRERARDELAAAERQGVV